MLVFGLVMSCGPAEDTDETKVTFDSVTANGDDLETTTELTLTFSDSITLSTDDITLSGVDDVEIDTLSGSGSTYKLKIKGFEDPGTLSVKVTNSDVATTTLTVYIYFVEPDQFPIAYRGIYSYKYGGANGTTETITFGANLFNIYDDSKGTAEATRDYLNFTITEWTTTTPASGYSDTYDQAYKFAGRMMKQKGYVPSTYTAPSANGFPASKDDTAGINAIVKEDGTGTPCTMYIYFKEVDANNIVFIRTAFTLQSTIPGVVLSSNNGTPPAGYDGITKGSVRVYTKQ